jgi:DMSO/TMAO reductase YedYZ molybdopterin-dependent catalytic subunit
MAKVRNGVSLTGALDHPLEMRFAHAEALGLTDRSAVVVCDSGRTTEIAGKGVALTGIFELAAVRETASTALFKCADGHQESVPLAELMLREGFLLYERPTALPRLVIPGRAGARWPSGIREIEFS